MDFQPKPYQSNAIEFLLATPRAALHAGIGSGKTAIALTAALRLWEELAVGRVLVVGPLNVVLNTIPDELAKWDHTCQVSHSVLHGPDKEQRLLDSSLVHAINYEGLEWFLRSPDRPFYDMVILDECHWVKSHQTKRFKMLRQFLHRVPRVVLMSGTPIGNNLADLWAQYFLLDGGERLFRSFKIFQSTYFKQVDYMGYQWEAFDWATTAVIKKVQDITFQVHVDDIELTELTEKEIFCELPTHVLDNYRELEREFLLRVEEAEIVAFNAAALATKLRQMANGFLYYGDVNAHLRQVKRLHEIKFDLLETILDEADENIMLVATFMEDFEVIRERFPRAAMINGRTKKTMARRAIVDWNEGRLPLLAIHPRSVGTGLNLQDGGCRQIWLSPDWSYLAKNQTVGRIHRTGQTKDVTVEVVVARGTIDEAIIAALREKVATTEEFARKLRYYRKLKLEER
jgi:SNF2 family DNA or RNA helicase